MPFEIDNTGSGGAGGNSFTTIQTPAGTSPVADSTTDTLTFTSSDATVTITGNSTTDTIDFTVGAAAAGITTVQEEGTPLTARTKLNFVGGGVTAADDAGNTRTNVTLDATLNALAAYNTNGLLAQTAADTFAGRTLTGTTNRIGVTNGDGVSGNPTLDIGSDVVVLTGTQSITGVKTMTTPILTGTPASAGGLGYDTSTGQVTAYSGLTASVGQVPRVLSVSRPGASLTNSTASDQDYSSIFTIPAGTLIANKIIRVTLTFQTVSGVSAATLTAYLKLGSTKIVITPTNAPTDSVTRSFAYTFLIIGTAAAGGSVSVEGNAIKDMNTIGQSGNNSVSQPVAGIATNGTLNIVPGATWSATGSTDTLTLLTSIVEELN